MAGIGDLAIPSTKGDIRVVAHFVRMPGNQVGQLNGLREAFDRFVQNEGQVVECASITGSNDYLLKVIAEDAEALELFIMKRILRLGLVRSSYTNFVLRRTKSSTALPV